MKLISVLFLLITASFAFSVNARQVSDSDLKAGYCLGVMKNSQLDPSFFEKEINSFEGMDSIKKAELLEETKTGLLDSHNRENRLKTYLFAKGYFTEENMMLRLVAAASQGEKDYGDCLNYIEGHLSLSCIESCLGKGMSCASTCAGKTPSSACKSIDHADCYSFNPY